MYIRRYRGVESWIFISVRTCRRRSCNLSGCRWLP